MYHRRLRIQDREYVYRRVGGTFRQTFIEANSHLVYKQLPCRAAKSVANSIGNAFENAVVKDFPEKRVVSRANLAALTCVRNDPKSL